jgi:hypothetical protein
MLELDERGVPGCFLATTAFKDAADLQCRVLGFRPAIVWLEHPIQNRTDAELQALAHSCVDEVIATITGSAGA